MKPLRLIFAFLFFCLSALFSAAPPVCAALSVGQYAKFEASFTIANQTGNPFDPADNDVEVTFVGPRKMKVVQPAFWDGDRWRVRYTPAITGSYTLTIAQNGVSIKPRGLSASAFTCIRSNNPGFVRLSPYTTQQFVLDTGQPYYPIGMDVAWQDGTPTIYPQTFAQMHQAGMNWARVWMNHWDGKNLEWAADPSQSPPPGTLLLSTARYWDSIITAAEQNGIYIQMTLQHHGQYTAHTDPNWADNPWNAANGGFLQNPDDFFTNAEARRLTKLKYRYITARYGYSTHLLSYELFNEVQNITEVQSHFGDVVAWHKEMASSIRSEDVNHHLLTTSNSVPGDPLAVIGLDYNQTHEYTNDLVSYFSGLTPDDTPLFTGEFGASGTQSEAILHDGLWSSLMAPTAGAGQFWYWDQVIANNWWSQFESASLFLKNYSVPYFTGMSAVPVTVLTSGSAGDLSFAPYGGYSTATRNTVTVPTDGSAPDLSGIPSYFQGNYHRDMMPNPTTFILNCAVPCQFRMDIGTVASSGAHPVMSVDGVEVTEADFPASGADHDVNQSLSVSVPAGVHQVSITNTGNDWFVVNSFTVTNYVPSLAVRAKGNSHVLVFWAFTQNRTGSTSNAVISFTKLTPGSYTVHLWNTWTGQPLPTVKAVRRASHYEINLPTVSRDIAGIVTSAR